MCASSWPLSEVIQGEHKVFLGLKTFITRKLRGIQKENMLKCTDVLQKKNLLSWVTFRKKIYLYSTLFSCNKCL